MKYVSHWLLRTYEYVVFYLGMLQIGLLCLLWSLSATLLRPLLPPAAGRLLGRAGIKAIFRIFLTTITLSGRFRFDLSELDAIKHEGALIIAPNHPSMWDVVLIVSRLPNVACIVKAEILQNIILGGGSRLAGYISAEPLRRMITLAVDDLHAGGRLLLFPEGTRTTRAPIGPLIGSLGLIAQRAQVPVQTVLIETDSPFLGKGWPIYRVPRLPLSYRVRLGRRFPAPQDGAILMAELTQYFNEALADPAATFPELQAEVARN
jgi:1-acyl-sn-glycerol-3-phosphate acyltransferase